MAGTINIKLDKDGKVHVDVDGCSGGICENLTSVLVGTLGEREEHVAKQEAYQNTEPDYVENLDG